MQIARKIGSALTLIVALAATPAAATEITRVVSPGGIEAWLVQEPSIPMISVEMAWEGGARMDPAGKEGLANMVSGLLDEGAGDIDSQAFQQRLKELALTLSFDAGKDAFFGSLRTLSKNREVAFELLALAINEPRFDAEPVERIRRQILTGIARNKTNPRTMARRAWFGKAYPGDGYGRPTNGDAETVAALTVDDLRGFVAERLARDNLVVSVVGDIAPEELGRLLDATFGGLPATSTPVPDGDDWPTGGGELQVVEHQTPQSLVLWGLPGVKRDDPDYYAAYVMNYVLGGGGLTSRLTDEVREKRGLTYSVYSYLSPLANTGLFMGGLASGNDTVAEAIEISRNEIGRMREGGVTEQELADAKTYLNGSFPLRLSSNRRIAEILLSVQRYDLGIDYLDRRAGYIDAVTREDIERVAKRLLDPAALSIVVVGKPKGIEGS